MSNDMIARLKITLDEVKPAVMRRVEVPMSLRLDRLHELLQAAFGWSNSHLYEFRVGDDHGWGLIDPDDDNGGMRDARKAKLVDLLEGIGKRRLSYLYDFGDGWEHTIKIESVEAATPGEVYPRLIQAAGRCPPDDVGGPWGYQEFLEAMADPKHERHDEFVEWIGYEPFDPNEPYVEARAAKVAALAKRLSRKPPGRKKRRG